MVLPPCSTVEAEHSHIVNMWSFEHLMFRTRSAHLLCLAGQHSHYGKASPTSLICLYVLIRSTDSLRSGAVAESRKVSGILLCRMARSGMICETKR